MNLDQLNHRLWRTGVYVCVFALVGVCVPYLAQAAVWHPTPLTTWQWQLTGTVDQSFDVQAYDIDLFDNTAATISSLHAAGRKVICYFSAGSYENWRPDASSFPQSVFGNNNGWPGEKWLDIRQLSVLEPIMNARFDLAVQKGCDAVEPDNVDGYANNTGLPLKASDQLAYNEYLAGAAHTRNLSVGLKNDLDQIPDLLSYFDWALDEQCNQYNECDTLAPFINANKAVFNAEYQGTPSKFCPKMNAMRISSIKKSLNLDAPMTACWAISSDPTPVVGDINLDHIVNSIDYSLLNAKWFTTDAASDLNHDGLVNAIDYSILNENWFKTW
ncbi:MAG TPA: endo alpha-1,4 polygalactosaminidase [Patescibacteria group bacterium]|nr:endo alpha-1,4 polygalactosaminidase [Patescibacteria group bacterium]